MPKFLKVISICANQIHVVTYLDFTDEMLDESVKVIKSI